MSTFPVDIVVPVWNRPVETRNCLVNLSEHSRQARLIFLDYGSDRETERLLQEFAEILDHRALLVRSDTNIGFVPAANRGLARAEAQYLAVVRNTSLVSAGWLDPILHLLEDREEAGVVIPKIQCGRQKAPAAASVLEADHGSFAAMILRRDLHQRIGGFDEGMDAGIWCLKDYSRRALQAGYLTFAVNGTAVSGAEEAVLGSETRRQERTTRSASLYRERWGEERAFCIIVPKGVTVEEFHLRKDLLLRAARQGHSLTIILPARLCKLLRGDQNGWHANLRFHQCPLILPDQWLKRRISELTAMTPEILFVQWVKGDPLPIQSPTITLEDLAHIVEKTYDTRYAGQPADSAAIREK